MKITNYKFLIIILSFFVFAVPLLGLERKQYEDAWLGISIYDVGQDAEEYGVEKGVIITGIMPNSPAKKSRLHIGDIITKVDGKQIKDHTEMTKMLNMYKPADTITVEIIREKKPINIKIELKKRPEYKRLSFSIPKNKEIVKLENEIKELIKKYQESTSEEEKQRLKNEVKETLTQLFDLTEGQREKIIAALDIRIKTLREVLANREKRKSEIIEHKLSELINNDELSKKGR